MRKTLLSLALLFGIASLSVNGKPLPTTMVQNITLTLTAMGPGKSTATGNTVSNLVVTTQTALKALAAATGNSVSAKARFLEMTPIGWATNSVVTTNAGKAHTNNYVYGYPGTPSFVIQDGAATVDVTPFVTIATVNADTIASSSHHKQGSQDAYTAYKSYRLRTISISAPPITFSAQGIVATPNLILTVAPGAVLYAYDDNWTSVSGHGNLGGNDLIFQGVISATFLKAQ